MPLNLERLRAGDRAEWNLAFDRLHLLQRANAFARRCLNVWGGQHLLEHANDVVNESLLKLIERAIHRCPSVEEIPALLRKIVGDEVVNILRQRFRQQQRVVGEHPAAEAGIVPVGDFLPDPDEAGESNLDRLRDQLAEMLGLAEFDLEVLLQRLVLALRLSTFDEMLLRDHFLGGQTQAAFAERNGCPIGRVGRRAAELRLRIRRWFYRKKFL